MTERSLIGQLIEDASTAAYKVTRERADNPSDEWIKAYVHACVERWREIPGINEPPLFCSKDDLGRILRWFRTAVNEGEVEVPSDCDLAERIERLFEAAA